MSQHRKTIWITGASSGIGKALALGYAAQGANLVLSARNVEKLQAVAEACQTEGEVFIMPLDIANYAALEAPVMDILREVPPIDILINNAGISQRCKVEDSTLALDQQIMDLNYFGVVAMTRLVLTQMIKRQKGHMVVISSIAGLLGTPYRSAYCASKHAVRAWYDALRGEVNDRNIQVTVVCPGYIKTDISINALGKGGQKHNKMDENQANGMDVETCAKIIIEGIEAGRTELLIGGKEKKAAYLKRFFPKLVEKKLMGFKPH